MSAPEPTQTPGRGLGYFILFGMAYAGGVIAYAPLLTLLLPMKVEALADDKILWLGVCTILGAVTASLTNIAAGHLSDIDQKRGRGRRRLMWIGLIATLVSYVGLWLSRTPVAVVVGVVAFQAAVNVMLAPLVALAVDETPDRQRGLAMGISAAVFPLGLLTGVLITASPAFHEGFQLMMVAALVVVGVVPFVVMRPPAGTPVPPSPVREEAATAPRELRRVWLARLFIQIAGNILFAYLFFYFESVSDWPDDPALPGRVALLSGVVAGLGAPISLVVGRMSDWAGARRPFLALTAALATGALFVMATSPGWTVAAAGYAVFSVCANVFLALSSAYAMQRLPSAEHRGRDMGVFNLTNTLPALIAPAFAVLVAEAHDFGPLMLILAVLAVIATAIALSLKEPALKGPGGQPSMKP